MTQVCTRNKIKKDFYFMVTLSDLAEVLHAVGDSLTALHIENSYTVHEREHCQMWLRELPFNGANLRKLDIIDLGNFALEEAILSAVSGRVQCLAVSGNHAECITNHFIGLQELHLGVLEVNSKDMWQALGTTLESLSIRRVASSIYKDTMRDIQTFFRKLSSVEIGFVEGLWDPHAELFMSFGALLKDALFINWSSAIPPAKIQEILAVCPNVGSGALLEDADEQSVKALAKRINAIETNDELVKWQDCPNVERSKLRPSSEEDLSEESYHAALQALHLDKKPKLIFLDFVVFEQRRITQALNAVAESTGALLKMHVMMGRQSPRSWETIARANPVLEDVRISYMLEEVDPFANGQPTGEIRTFSARFGEAGRATRDEFVSKGMMAEGFVPCNAILHGDRV